MKKIDIKTYLLLTLASVFWGVSFILTKQLFLTEEHMTVTILITFRLAIATVVMFPLLALSGKLQLPSKSDIKWFLLLALCEPFIYHICETSGVQCVSGSLASVIIATIPLFVPFGIWLAYRRKPGTSVLIGVTLSLIGVILLLNMSSHGEAHDVQPIGLLYLTGAVAIAVVYTLLLVKIVDHYNPIVITTWQNLIGLIYFIPLMLSLDAGNVPNLSYSANMIGLLLILGICCSTLAYACFNYGIRKLGASQASIFNNTIPIFSFIAAVAIGQEGFGWAKLAGIIIVIVGVVIAQKENGKKVK